MSGTNKDEYIRELAFKWINGSITPKEQAIFAKWYNEGQFESIIVELDFVEDEQSHRDRMLAAITMQNSKSDKQLVKKNFISIFRIAAAILVLLSVAFYMFYAADKKHVLTAKNTVTTGNADVNPGGIKATLTLANGKKIRLDEAKTGQLATEAGISIRKTEGNIIIYDILDNNKHSGGGQGELNTIETPAGGEYQVNLPDGSRVWLNSLSSLKFPVIFTNNERHVELFGEAYFEIVKNKLKPFRVSTNKIDIKVLGTHFNLMSYSEDHVVSTTLIEGSIAIKSSSGETLLRPGEQAQFDRNNGSIKVLPVDTDFAVAWKNGYFSFYNEDIQSVMTRVSRWYDVDVVYQGKIMAPRLGGTFSRNKKISELLDYLEKLGDFHFKIVGRRVIVMQ